MKEVTLELLIKSLINDFREYQKEWLTSHCDIEFDRPEEDLILAFLDDTADSYISEHIEFQNILNKQAKSEKHEHSCCYWENNECILGKDYCPDDYGCDSFD